MDLDCESDFIYVLGDLNYRLDGKYQDLTNKDGFVIE